MNYSTNDFKKLNRSELTLSEEPSAMSTSTGATHNKNSTYELHTNIVSRNKFTQC